MIPYTEASEELKLELHKRAMQLRENNFGYRKIKSSLKEEFSVDIPEPTISQWIYYGRIPGNNKISYFKPKPMPKKREIFNLYFKNQLSMSEVSKKYGVSSVTAKKWVEKYGKSTRNKKDSMNTSRVRKMLREKKLIKPPKNVSTLTKEKSYILGVLCGDGHINKNFMQLEISKSDEEFMKRFLRCVYLVYGWKFNYHYRIKKNTVVTYVSPEYIVDDILSLSTFGVRKWRVPKCIVNSKDISNIVYFLRGFYDSEGCVGRHQVMFTVVNKKGAMGIVDLLDNFQIKTSFKHYNRVGIGDIYTVSIYGKKNIKTFKDRVGFSLSRKQGKLSKAYPNWVCH